MASSSVSLPLSLAATEWKYDVFLSFRGADTRKGITSDLYHRLHSSGIKTFMDDPDLEVGDAISRTLIEAIEQSRFAVVVLSRDYASSTWCMEELAKICECMEDKKRILPLFYHVDPTDVRYQKKSFQEAFSKHESSGRHESQKVKQWRGALNKVATFSGWNTNDYKTEKELVEKIVDFVCERIQPFDTESIMCTADFEPYVATRKAMGEVMKALEDDNVTAVGVFGMGGVGKTTMVQEVAAQSRKNGVFHHVIMAVVSQSPNLRLIQGALADMLGVKLVEETELGRAGSLNREIMRRENILIILDDVWKTIKLSTIGIPSHEQLQRCHSKVILTTRRRQVCLDMKCQEKITLDTLSEEDSWTLFVRSARRSLESTTFEGVAKKVAGECRGLPIALIAVARALAYKDHAEWEKAARRLEKSQSAIVEDEQDAFECIKFSFDYLKDEDSKSCLLLCCLFPEDHVIEIEELLRYAVRTTFFQKAQTIEDARGELVSIVKHLEDSSLLLYSQEYGCVKMHDVIRDTAIQIAESERGFRVKAGFGLENWPRGLDEGCTTISLMGNEIRKLPEEELVCPALQILLLNWSALNEIPETFIKILNELRILDVSNTSISVLPQSFSLLTNLQALYLDDCEKLIDISVVGKLKKLEILSMRQYPKEELPREIGHLTNLRILDVNCSGGKFELRMAIIPSEVISKLHKLEELYMFGCRFEDWGWGCAVKRRGGETSMLASLSYLKILQVRIPGVRYIPKTVEAKPDWDYFCIYIGSWDSLDRYKLGDHNSRSLFLDDATISILPDWFTNAMTEKIEKLEYRCCKGMLDILMEYDHGRLHELKHLQVRGTILRKVDLKELMNTTGRVQKGPVFEKLEELYLKHLIDLEELCVGELPPGSLFNLKVLHMDYCPKLKNVSKLVQRVPSLEILVLNYMHKLEYVFGCEGSELKESKLREVYLLDLYSVKSICRGPAPRVMFKSIKILTIFYCKLLKSLFTSDVAQCLFQLEDLVVGSCPLLERVIEEAANNEKTALPKLKKLILKDLPVLYGASSTVDIVCPSLEHLIVEDCPNISFSISASDYFGNMNPVQLNDRQLYRSLLHRAAQIAQIEFEDLFHRKPEQGLYNYALY